MVKCSVTGSVTLVIPTFSIMCHVIYSQVVLPCRTSRLLLPLATVVLQMQSLHLANITTKTCGHYNVCSSVVPYTNLRCC